jgi:hypothetical protein
VTGVTYSVISIPRYYNSILLNEILGALTGSASSAAIYRRIYFKSIFPGTEAIGSELPYVVVASVDPTPYMGTVVVVVNVVVEITLRRISRNRIGFHPKLSG